MSDSFLAVATSRACDAAGEPTPRVDTSVHIAAMTESIEKPDLDTRSYRHLRLHNQLQVMLVSDPACDHAAAAMEVGVGSASDPESFPGLAHFLEHMLFLGWACARSPILPALLALLACLPAPNCVRMA
jgi:hypothetical protein